MRINQKYIQRSTDPNRPSLEDYNAAHWFLVQVKQSTILSVAEKNELRYKALHGGLQEAREIYEDIVARDMAP